VILCNGTDFPQFREKYNKYLHNTFRLPGDCQTSSKIPKNIQNGSCLIIIQKEW